MSSASLPSRNKQRDAKNIEACLEHLTQLPIGQEMAQFGLNQYFCSIDQASGNQCLHSGKVQVLAKATRLTARRNTNDVKWCWNF